jgi:transposase
MDFNTTNNVFLGIDVHKRTYSVTAVSENKIIKRASMPADKNVLLAFIRKHFSSSSVCSVYEAGFSGFGLHRFLEENGIKNTVVHAASIETAINNRSKTDKRDSERMAVQLSQGKLKCVNIPSNQREYWRTVTRLRLQYVGDRTRIACRIKSLLYYFDMIPYFHKGKTSRKWVTNLLNLELNEDLSYCLENLVQTWLKLDDSIKNIDKRLKDQAKKDSQINTVYMSMDGLGLTSARILANELGNLIQFKSEKALSCWIGLTPTEHSSGDHKWLGHITRQGKPLIRGILVECAWKAIRINIDLASYFDRIVRNTGSRKKAIVAVARKMICQIRTKFIKGKTFMKHQERKTYEAMT